MAAKGYPGDYEKGSVIKNLEAAGKIAGVKIFHAGTQDKDGNIVASGGRVLGVTAVSGTLKDAQKLAYSAVDMIDWPDGFCRRDIGSKAIR
jgi:phosphoribosylamine--glycine ligase